MPKYPELGARFEDLPQDTAERLDSFVEFFGHHLVWTRDLVLSRVRECFSSTERTQQLSEDSRKIYEEIGRANPETQRLALGLAKETADFLLYWLLALLANIGIDFKLDEKHVIWYKLILQICNIETDQVVEEQLMNRDLRDYLPDYLQRWLGKYGRFE
jgi:hypothetical protein